MKPAHNDWRNGWTTAQALILVAMQVASGAMMVYGLIGLIFCR